MTIKKRYFLVIVPVVFSLLLLVGCGDKTEQNGPMDITIDAPDKPDVKSGPKELTYEDGLVSLHIDGDKAEISFDYSVWEERYKLSDITDSDYYDTIKSQNGPFPIKGLDGGVQDACIGQAAGLDALTYSFITPAVVLLMEDGSLRFVLADPFTDGDGSTFPSQRLPWLEDIESLAYVSTDGDTDAMRIIATDSKGEVYDTGIPAGFLRIFDKPLYCDQPAFDEYNDSHDYMTLELHEDGTVSFEKYMGGEGAANAENDQKTESYEGTYEVRLAENSPGDGPQSGSISFDLRLQWWIWESGEGMEQEDLDFWDEGQALDGTYFSRIEYLEMGEAILYLYYDNGKGLVIYRDHRMPDSMFEFYTHDLYSEKDAAWGGGGDEYAWYYGSNDDEEGIGLALYVMDHVPDVYEKVMVQGMMLWADGNVTNYSDGDVGKNVLLLEYVPGEFGGTNTVATYAVIDGGTIYKYNEEDNMWYRSFSW